MRCGSVVVDMKLASSPRHGSRTANCPYLELGTCGVCIDRCPAGAIASEGKDNVYLFEVIGPQVNRMATDEAIEATQSSTAGRLGVCGLCHTGVPCESQVPPPSLYRVQNNTPC